METARPKKEQKNEIEEIFEDIQNSKIYRYFDRKMESEQAYTFLGILAFLDTVFLFIPLEPFVALFAIKQPQKRIWAITAYTTLLNVLGYSIVFFIGYFASDFALGLAEQFFGELPISDITRFLTLGAIPFAAISAFFSFPIPLTPFTLTAGILQVAYIPFVIGIIIGKGGRYVVSAYVGRYYGVRFLEAVARHTAIFYGLLLLVSLLIWLRFF